jgi:dienelactone hydrolase
MVPPTYRRPIERVILLVAIVACVSCATPAQRIDAYAQAQRFTRAQTPGGPFQLVTYYNDAAQQLRASGFAPIVHVYLEGDGTPWLDATYAAADPTPRDPLALRLMAHDPAPSVYLGRPCYHGFAQAAECNPLLWTHARYGVAVVERMTSALRRVLAGLGQPRVVFVGYSGGGVLAMLLAARFESTIAVVTVASNLDIEAWAQLHGYSALAGSLNPAREPPLSPAIVQMHLVGARDEIVPPALVGAAVAGQAMAVVEMFEEYDHVCCWEQGWPDILGRLDQRITPPAGMPGR